MGPRSGRPIPAHHLTDSYYHSTLYSDVSPFPKKENGCGFRFRLPVGLCSRSQRSKSARRQRRIRPVPALI